MSTIERNRINLSSPNLLNICVDKKDGGDISGRIYHCYQQEPILFQNVIELIREAEQLFDTIGFPQASTKSRSFGEVTETVYARKRPERVVPQQQVAEHQGKKGTFITSVRLRQSATWQGEFYWAEQERIYRFSNTLDFIKQIDTAVW